jgi:hypothetical protein
MDHHRVGQWLRVCEGVKRRVLRVRRKDSRALDYVEDRDVLTPSVRSEKDSSALPGCQFPFEVSYGVTHEG